MMTKDGNIEKRLIELITAYGADPKRWPDNERDTAVAFMQANPKMAASSMKEAQSLDQMLDSEAKHVSNTDFLAARILKTAQELDEKESPANDFTVGPALLPNHQPAWRSIAATFIITTGVGFAMGQSAAAKSDRIAAAETLLSLTLENPYESAGIWENL